MKTLYCRCEKKKHFKTDYCPMIELSNRTGKKRTSTLYIYAFFGEKSFVAFRADRQPSFLWKLSRVGKFKLDYDEC